MYNKVLERQADGAKSVIEDLITEIHELEEVNEKLENTVDDLEDIIISLKARLHELESKLDN